MTIDLRYGCNPHQQPASFDVPAAAGFKILNGTPGYINILDALGAWQLVRELALATGKPGAASFKHTSPAGAAVARPLSDHYKSAMMISDEDLSPVATAYIRARGGDRISSFGDAAAVSHIVDESLAKVLQREVSDLIIAPGYTPEALEILKRKKKGGYLVMQIDPDYAGPENESREIFGFAMHQPRNNATITREMFQNIVTQDQSPIPEDVLDTLIVGTIALKYTQSNSMCVAYDGQVIGMGAGQQSRIHCTRLACDKADKWFLQQHPRVLDLDFADGLKRMDRNNLVDQYLLWDQLSDHEREATLTGFNTAPEPLDSVIRHEWIAGFDGICLCSDAFIPFRDNVDRASRSHVQYIAQTGQSLRDADTTAAAEEYGMIMIHTGVRLFLH